jgi:hypothetical protein
MHHFTAEKEKAMFRRSGVERQKKKEKEEKQGKGKGGWEDRQNQEKSRSDLERSGKMISS